MVSALQSSKAQQRKRNQSNTMVQKKKKKNTTTNIKTTRKGKEKTKDAPTDQQKKEKRKKKVMSDEELKVFLEVIELQQKMEGKIKWTDINRTYFHGKFSANFLFQKYKRTIKPQEHKLTWCVEAELELLLLVPRYTSQDSGEISWATLLKEEFFDSESISCTQLNNKYKSIMKPTKKNMYLEKMLLEMTEKDKNLLMSTRRTMRRQRVLSKEFISLKQPRVHNSNSSSSSSPPQRVQHAGFKPKDDSTINKRANEAKQKEPLKREVMSSSSNSGPPRRKRRLVVDDSETGESDDETTPETKKPAKKKNKTLRHCDDDDDEASNESLRPQRQQHQKEQVNMENNRESDQKREGELYLLDEPTRRVTRSQMAAKSCPDKFKKINYCEGEEEESSLSDNEMDYELPNSCWQEEEEQEQEEEEEEEVELQNDVVTTFEPFIESKREVEREDDEITSLEEEIHEEEEQREDEQYVLPIVEREEPVLDYEPSLFEGSDTPEDHTLIHDPATGLTREDIFGVGEELNIEHDEEIGNQFIWDLKTMDPIPDVCSLDREIPQQPKEPGTKEQKKEPFGEYDDEDDDQIISGDYYYSTSCTPMTAFDFSEDEILHSYRFD